jgi:hypothetical protein
MIAAPSRFGLTNEPKRETGFGLRWAAPNDPDDHAITPMDKIPSAIVASMILISPVFAHDHERWTTTTVGTIFTARPVTSPAPAFHSEQWAVASIGW